jgi:hypothetical protein
MPKEGRPLNFNARRGQDPSSPSVPLNFDTEGRDPYSTPISPNLDTRKGQDPSSVPLNFVKAELYQTQWRNWGAAIPVKLSDGGRLQSWMVVWIPVIVEFMVRVT